MDRIIYLIRHGKTIGCERKRYIGTTDLPLSNEGINEARLLKEYFASINIEKMYLSPLTRCVQTADIISEGRDIEKIIVDELKEIHMGHWEGKTFTYIKERYPVLYEKRGKHIDMFKPPGGESFYELQKRVVPVFENIVRTTTGNIIIIAHAGVNRVILSKLLDFSLSEIFKLCQPYGCINKLFWDKLHERWQYETIVKR